MLRSEINRAFRAASDCFACHHWALPPQAKWDITDFGLGDFEHYGLSLINLAAEPEYCEKLMYARFGQVTPCHTHAKKKEDIICRVGRLVLSLSASRPPVVSGSDLRKPLSSAPVKVSVNGAENILGAGQVLVLPAGHRVTLLPGTWHSFWPESEECIIGEVSTANDDMADNVFLDPAIGRFPGVEEDEAAQIRLLSDK